MIFSKASVLELCKASTYHKEWEELDGKRCMMVCHDQDIDRRILQESETLISNGYNVMIICLSFDNHDMLEKKDGVFIHRIGLSKIVPDCKIYWYYQWFVSYALTIDNINYKLSNWFRKFSWLKYKLLLKLVYRNSNIGYPLPFDYPFKYALEKYSANLIIAHDLPALKASVKRGEELGIPVIYDAHEFYIEQKAFLKYQKKIMLEYEQEYITKCKEILTVNSTFIELFKKRYGVKSGHVIRNSHKFHVIKPITTLHEKIGKPFAEKIILFQGGVVGRRNLENLLKGFLILQREAVNLVFMGPQDPLLVESLKKIAANQLGKSVFFLDPVPQQQLIDHAATATFGVVPYPACDLNTRYCTPNKLFEYIQAELPILFNNELEEVAQIISEIGGGGIGVSMSSPENVRKGLEIMLERNLNDDKQLLQRAKHDVCWEKDAEKLKRIVSDLMDK